MIFDNTDQFGFGNNGRAFDDPFLLYSSQSMPRDLTTALDWCRFLYFLNAQYRQAASRVILHFITDFDYPDGGDQKERDELDDLLHFKLKLPLMMAEMGDEFACYGNCFVRIHFPFDRFLIDPETRSEYSIDMFKQQDMKFDLASMTYEVPNPRATAGKGGKRKLIKMAFRDRKSKDTDRIKLIKIDPNYITIEHNRVSSASRYIWRFDELLIHDTRKGKLFVVNDLPQSMLTAIRDKQDFLFSEGQLYHFKAPTISGISNNGWGIPGTLASFRSIHQLQVYRKIDEAIGLDYMTPFRIFTPVPSDKISDVFNTLIMGQWTSSMKHIIDARRTDKFAMHALPFPVNYQEFGGQGKELTPKDLVEYQTNSMLDGMGFPVELFKCSLQYMQIPTAMRMFENSFMFVHVGFSDFTKWVVSRVRSYLGQPAIRVDLQKPGMADSLERKQIILQLASAGEISRETAYELFGIENPINEIKKRMQEDIGIQKAKLKLDQEYQREQESGTLLASDGQGQMAPGIGASPTDVQNEAQSLAQYWLSIPSDGERRTAMQSTRQASPQLYAMAKEVMEQTRQQGASQGRQQANQQAQQGGQTGPGGGAAGQPPTQ